VDKEMSRDEQMEAIRKYCILCSGKVDIEVKNCPMKKCPLWVYRRGEYGGE